MAKSMPNPWIKDLVLNIIIDRNEKEVNSSSGTYIGSKMVQVIKVFDQLNMLIVNDRQHYITVFLTTICANRVRNNHGSLDILKNALAKMDQFHLSTVIQCCSERDLDEIYHIHKISLPFALQSNYLELAGNSDLTIMSEPCDINHDSNIRSFIFDLPYIVLVSKLVSKQFPTQQQLPDAEGRFCLPVYGYDDDHPLHIQDAVIPKEQQELLNQIDTYEHSILIKTFHSRNKVISTNKTVASHHNSTSTTSTVPIENQSIHATNHSSESQGSSSAVAIESTQLSYEDDLDFLKSLAAINSGSSNNDSNNTQPDCLHQQNQYDPLGENVALVTETGRIAISNSNTMMKTSSVAKTVNVSPSSSSAAAAASTVAPNSALRMIQDYSTQDVTTTPITTTTTITNKKNHQIPETDVPVIDSVVPSKKSKNTHKWDQFIGRTINKLFDGKIYKGTVLSYDKPFFRVLYDDGDFEDISNLKLKKVLVPLSKSTNKSKIILNDNTGTKHNPVSFTKSDDDFINDILDQRRLELQRHNATVIKHLQSTPSIPNKQTISEEPQSQTQIDSGIMQLDITQVDMTQVDAIQIEQTGLSHRNVLHNTISPITMRSPIHLLTTTPSKVTSISSISTVPSPSKVQNVSHLTTIAIKAAAMIAENITQTQSEDDGNVISSSSNKVTNTTESTQIASSIDWEFHKPTSEISSLSTIVPNNQEVGNNLKNNNTSNSTIHNQSNNKISKSPKKTGKKKKKEEVYTDAQNTMDEFNENSMQQNNNVQLNIPVRFPMISKSTSTIEKVNLATTNNNTTVSIPTISSNQKSFASILANKRKFQSMVSSKNTHPSSNPNPSPIASVASIRNELSEQYNPKSFETYLTVKGSFQAMKRSNVMVIGVDASGKIIKRFKNNYDEIV